jgi:hypothetical protein
MAFTFLGSRLSPIDDLKLSDLFRTNEKLGNLKGLVAQVLIFGVKQAACGSICCFALYLHVSAPPDLHLKFFFAVH